MYYSNHIYYCPMNTNFDAPSLMYREPLTVKTKSTVLTHVSMLFQVTRMSTWLVTLVTLVTFVTLGRVAAKQRSGTAKPTETFVTSLAQTLTTHKTNHQCKSETINHQLWMNISSPMFYV